MFTQGDLPDVGRAIAVLFVGTLIGVALGGYELIRLLLWLYRHVHISLLP